MIENNVDLLKIKIDKAKSELSPKTVRAIDAVNWQAVILSLRETKGYSFEQLGDLEMETELLLAGLLSPDDYPKELQNRMGISKAETDNLVNEMNTLVFKRIREEMVRNTGRTETPEQSFIQQPPTPKKEELGVNATIMKSAGIEIMPTNLSSIVELPAGKTTAPAITTPTNREEMLKNIEKPEPIAKIEMHPMLEQKMSTSFQIPMVKTEHSLDNLSKTSASVPQAPRAYPPKADPYRLPPE